MNKRKLPGIASATYRLASGKIQRYYYAWRGGPLLKAADGTPLQPSEPEFFTAYAKAHAERAKPAPGTLFSLIAEYRRSSDFPRNPKTAKDYQRYLKLIEEKFGTMPLSIVEDKRARGEFKAWRDTMADRPRTADYAWTVLARVLSFGVDRGVLTINVCRRGGRLYASDRADIIWTADHIRDFLAAASPPLQSALMLALWTGQRQTDLIRLTWMQYDGTKLRLKQGKSKRRIAIPVGIPLKVMLDAQRPAKPEGTILRNTRGKPWTSDGFRTSWGVAFTAAGLGDEDLHFHDLRGTAVTRLALAGCPMQEIASVTGHSLSDVERILDAHYLGGRTELAEQAIVRLNARYDSGTETAK